MKAVLPVAFAFAAAMTSTVWAAKPQATLAEPPALTPPGTHYWWLTNAMGNVPGADSRVCSGEGEEASPEKLCGSNGVYLGHCGTGAVFGVRGILMPRKTPAEMQIVLLSRGGSPVLYCHRVMDRSSAKDHATRFQGREVNPDAPGLADALAQCGQASGATCRLAWYGFEPAGGPENVFADQKLDAVYRVRAK